MMQNNIQRSTSRTLSIAGFCAAAIGVIFAAGIASAQTAPAISSISATPSANGAMISWMTDQGANAQVLYGTSTPYTASTSATAGFVSTTQSVALSNLTSGTLYHFAVVSANASGSASTSADQTFMTLAATSTVATTPTASATISLNPSSGMPGSSFTITGNNFAASEGITLSFNGATSSAGADAGGMFSTSLTVPSAATSTGNVWVSATGNTSGRTAGAWFDILPSSSSTSPILTTIENEIAQLQSQVTQLMNELQTLLTGNGNGSGSGNNSSSSSSGSFPSSTLAATIDQTGSVRAGTSIDFTGRNWGTDEKVQVTSNGNVVTTAQADDGGNFSTGSLPVTNTAGTQTYTFTGVTTGLTRTVTVTVTQ